MEELIRCQIQWDNPFCDSSRTLMFEISFVSVEMTADASGFAAMVAKCLRSCAPLPPTTGPTSSGVFIRHFEVHRSSAEEAYAARLSPSSRLLMDTFERASGRQAYRRQPPPPPWEQGRCGPLSDFLEMRMQRRLF